MKIDRLKARLRQQARENLAAVENADELSAQILSRILLLDEYHRADTVLFYVDVRHEVRTRPALHLEFHSSKVIAVPWCNGDELELFHLESLDELRPVRFGIPEPPAALRTCRSKVIQPGQVDLALVPGVAFDRRGGRIGHGKGYYDRLLKQVRPDCLVIAPAFEAQVFDEVPMQEHDVWMHRVVTESASYSFRDDDR